MDTRRIGGACITASLLFLAAGCDTNERDRRVSDNTANHCSDRDLAGDATHDGSGRRISQTDPNRVDEHSAMSAPGPAVASDGARRDGRYDASRTTNGVDRTDERSAASAPGPAVATGTNKRDGRYDASRTASGIDRTDEHSAMSAPGPSVPSDATKRDGRNDARTAPGAASSTELTPTRLDGDGQAQWSGRRDDTDRTDRTDRPDRTDGQAHVRTTDAVCSDGATISKLVAMDNCEVLAASHAMHEDMSAGAQNYARLLYEAHSKHLSETLKLAQSISVNPEINEDVERMYAKGARELRKLVSLDGRSFEQAYLDAMIHDHTEALEAIDARLASNPRQEIRDHLAKTRVHVASHLQIAKDLKAGRTPVITEAEPHP